MNRPSTTDQPTGKIRLDKWLWAARFYKTRSLSSEEIDKGRVKLNGAPAKPSRDVKAGDVLELRIGHESRTVIVRELSGTRGPAPIATRLYEETAESIAQRQAAAERRRLAPEPALSQPTGRPTKRDRRSLSDWGQRWSASMDEEP